MSENTVQTPFSYKIAKLIRILTLPPILITSSLIVLYFVNRYVFNSYIDLIVAIISFGIFPVLAYPVQLIIPSLKNKGRRGQRFLAFVFNLIGYTAGLLYGIFGKVTAELLFVFIAYFVSVVLLTIVNKILKIKASGHACGSAVPCTILSYLCKWYCVFPCLVILAASAWASIHLKRHKAHELLLGAAVGVVAFVISLLFYLFLLR